MDREGKMVSELNYDQKFQIARTAYIEGDLDKASNIVEEMFRDDPDDPNVLLLRGHINFSHNEYDVAKKNYQKVLYLTEREELLELARESLEKIENELRREEYDDRDELFSLDSSEFEDLEFSQELENIDDLDMDSLDGIGIDENDEDAEDGWTESIQFENIEWDTEELQEELEDITDPSMPPEKVRQEKPTYVPEDEESSFNFEDEADDTASSLIQNTMVNEPITEAFENDSLLDDFDAATLNYNQIGELGELSEFDEFDEFDDLETDGELNEHEMEDHSAPTFAVAAEKNQDPELRDLEQILTDDHQLFNDNDDDYSSALQPLVSDRDSDLSMTEAQVFDDNQPLVPEGEEDFFFAPDDIDDIPDIDAEELPVSSIFTKENKTDINNGTGSLNDALNPEDNVFDNDFDSEITGSFAFDTEKINLDMDEDISISSRFSEPSLVNSALQATPEVEITQNKIISNYDNSSLFYKQLIHGGLTAIVTFVAVILVGMFSSGEKVTTDENSENTPPETTTEQAKETLEQKAPIPWKLGLIGGLTGGVVTIGSGIFLNRHLKRYLDEFKNQFDSIYQGDYDVKVTIYSQDEFGSLAATFNQMSKMIKTTTKEARKRAEETERAREDLQRQVIRLLDDVEGAARGDLTVQAEVTADVLGAVADAFNLTITSLRKIVKQVQQAAIQVNKASADSELYARNQSSDALRMAEELAVTLNSVQMMTDSIQRVAENAQEAEEVARSSSVTALKGGDAVERTVAGILQIRETVSETTRKVKRLAEASQQISTIVAVISQISSRTNLLALNASIQAARAGEAGRGFAIVADEVRQLADRSAKSLQEIEQIVLQIQTETGSVMTAMEEGIQQVKDVTERSEQAKRSLEDIIQVSNRIDALVRSITADTDEQRQNSRDVAKVMQEVELTAQATSKESQRVAGSLQNLVGIGKDLIASVERFKVD